MTILDQYARPVSASSAHRGASFEDKAMASWQPSLGSADSDLLGELPALVARSRDLTRNHGIAAGAIQTLMDNVVGTGLRLVATPDFRLLGQSKEWADNWAAEVESHWRSWAEQTSCDATGKLNFAGLTAQAYRSVLVNGEALALPLWLPQRRNNNGFATAIQLIESDRLSNPQGRLDDRNLRAGIEIDRYGAAKAYWLRKTHPGDALLNFASDEQAWQRVSSYTRFGRRRVLHLHEQERTGQNRGKPALASVLPLFKMLDHYELSELKAAIVNAMIAAFIESPVDSEMLYGLFGGSSEKIQAHYDAKQQNQVQMEAGMIMNLAPGEKMSSFMPSRPNTAYGDFVENIQRHIGTGVNLPLELLTKNFSKTNYSSARASLLEAWRYFNGRRQWLATYWAKPIYELWLEEAINKGLITAPDFYQNRAAWQRCKWIGPGRGWIDPVKEAKAAEIRMAAGLSTLEDECASQGLDWEEVVQQRAREQARLAELGLTTTDLVMTEQQEETAA